MAGKENSPEAETTKILPLSTNEPAGTDWIEPSMEDVHAAWAMNLREVIPAAYMYSAVARSVTDSFDTPVYKAYRDQLLQDSGAPTDPLEVMLIEQMAIAHFNIGRLHMKSGSIGNDKLAIAYSDAATRLLGEFRRCTLALEEYRGKQIARIEGAASPEDTQRPSPTPSNGKPVAPPQQSGVPNGKLTCPTEVPQCLIDRIQKMPAEQRLPDVTRTNGRA